MTTSKIDTVVEELMKEESRLEKELVSLKNREQELKVELKRVQAGLTGLGQKKRAAKAKNTSKKSSKSKPAAAETTPEENLFEIDFAQ